MNTQRHRTCIRMSQEEYDLLKKKSRAAGLSANAWLMRELERNRPILYREKETRAAIAFADEAGRDINAVARVFNSGCGTAQQLGFSVHRLAQVVEQSGRCESWGTPMRYKHKPRPPMWDNSCSLSVRMTDEQYQRLCRYLAITRLPVTTYFRKLIKETTIHARMPRQKIDPHPAVNHIYSNIRQIARCPRARELAPEQIAQLEFLADKLCEECFLLSTQQ